MDCQCADEQDDQNHHRCCQGHLQKTHQDHLVRVKDGKGLFLKAADDAAQLLDLLCAELFASQQGGEQLVGRAVIDAVD